MTYLEFKNFMLNEYLHIFYMAKKLKNNDQDNVDTLMRPQIT